MIKKLVVCFLILVSLFFVYRWLFPSLEDQFFTAVKEKCSREENCMIHLHEITSFKWDKAYFFPSGNSYSNQDIKNITGVTGNFQRNNTLVIFTYNNRLVKYDFLSMPESDDVNELPTKSTNFSIGFNMEKKILQHEKYSGNLDSFEEYIRVRYYKITPDNDLFFAGYTSEKYSLHDTQQALIIFSNINQICLDNSKDNNKQ